MPTSPSTSHPAHSTPHDHAAPLTTGALAARLKAELIGPDDIPISRVAAIDDAQGPAEGVLTFIRSQRFAAAWSASRARAALVTRGVKIESHAPASRALLIVPDADHALNIVLALLSPALKHDTGGTRIDPSAVVDPSAQIGPGVIIGPLCRVGPGATIGARSHLVSGVHIGAHARIGDDCTFHPASVLYDHCIVGDRCVVHAAAVIGADGFGYFPGRTPQGAPTLIKVPHIGIARIASDVEIGAGSCIDRAKFGATTVGDGTKIDNLVQIGHNCSIGRLCVICGQAGLAGSVTVGDGVQIGGQVGVADNLTIGDGARIGAQSGVMEDVPPGATIVGSPALPARQTMKLYATLKRMIGARPEPKPTT